MRIQISTMLWENFFKRIPNNEYEEGAIGVLIKMVLFQTCLQFYFRFATHRSVRAVVARIGNINIKLLAIENYKVLSDFI